MPTVFTFGQEHQGLFTPDNKSDRHIHRCVAFYRWRDIMSIKIALVGKWVVELVSDEWEKGATYEDAMHLRIYKNTWCCNQKGL